MTIRPNRTRRGLLSLAGAAAAAPALIIAQQPPKRVTIVAGPHPAARATGPLRAHWAKFFAPHGLFDGKNLELQVVRASFRADETEEIARAAIASRPDVILVHGLYIHLFKSLTREIPLIFMAFEDPERWGLVESLRRPGGNVTGVAIPLNAIKTKWLQLLKDLRPDKHHRVADVFESYPETVPAGFLEKHMEITAAAANALGMTHVRIIVGPEDHPDVVAQKVVNAHVHSVMVMWPMLHQHGPEAHARFIAHLTSLRLPSVFGIPYSVRQGGLMSYFMEDRAGDVVELAARVLRGEKPATLPVTQGQTGRAFPLLLNLRTARALGITVPASILIAATEIIE